MAVSMIKQVTSAGNPVIKMIRSLERRKAREETELFMAEGERLVRDAAGLGWQPEWLVFAGGDALRPSVATLVETMAAAGVTCLETTERVMGQIARRDNPQTVIGVYRQRWAELSAVDARTHFCWVVLQAVRDPGNLGTILRTADAVGAGGVILLGASCDPYSLEAVRASMGSVFALSLARAELETFTAWRHGWGGTVIGAAPAATASFQSVACAAPVFLMMGNEQSGLPPEFAGACDALVRIPMRGSADSLNLAVATGVMLYELWGRAGFPGQRS